MNTKIITLHFQVPENTDWPSEDLAAAKELILDQLNQADRAGILFSKEKEIVDALLAET